MKNKIYSSFSAVALGALLSFTTSIVSAQYITLNLVDNYDAADPGSTSGVWASTTDTGDDWTLTGSPPNVSVSSSLAGITNAFSFDGTTQYGVADSFKGALSTVDSTWEFWVKPDNLTSVHGFFETGGNSQGLTFKLNNDVLNFYTKDDTTITLSTTLTSGMITDFIQVVGVVDATATTPTTYLYVNGSLVDSVELVENWRGSDDARIGGTGNSVGGSSRFAGDIAIARVYDTAFDASQVLQNYTAVAVPETSAFPIFIGLFMVLFYLLRRRFKQS